VWFEFGVAEFDLAVHGTAARRPSGPGISKHDADNRHDGPPGDTRPILVVSRLAHSLQSATRAERDARPVDYVVAALTHDIGDGLAPYSHGSYAAAVLRPFVSDELCWIVSHHPLFQMHYYGAQTGDDVNAREAYRGHPWFDATVEFCERYDENCFDPDYDWLPLEHFAPAVEEVFSREPAFH
jgi:predicted HD phosphohydrolase